jgi:phage shock protein A
MSIMTRMVRLCKADVHGVMDQLEDKGLLLKQYVREMESSLDHKERQLEALTARLDQSSSRIVRHTEEMEKLEQDLNLALSKEKDDIARMLIRRRRMMETGVRQLTEQIEVMSQEKRRLSETLTHQRLQLETIKAKADTYCLRAHERRFEEACADIPTAFDSSNPSDAEIEMELLQRKEQLGKGETP